MAVAAVALFCVFYATLPWFRRIHSPSKQCCLPTQAIKHGDGQFPIDRWCAHLIRCLFLWGFRNCHVWLPESKSKWSPRLMVQPLLLMLRSPQDPMFHGSTPGTFRGTFHGKSTVYFRLSNDPKSQTSRGFGHRRHSCSHQSPHGGSELSRGEGMSQKILCFFHGVPRWGLLVYNPI